MATHGVVDVVPAVKKEGEDVARPLRCWGAAVAHRACMEYGIAHMLGTYDAAAVERLEPRPAPFELVRTGEGDVDCQQ